MGLFDWFRRRASPDMEAKIAYDLAYFLLPDILFKNPQQLDDVASRLGAVAGPFLYAAMARLERVAANPETASRYLWRRGELDGRPYYLLEYPPPSSPVDETTEVVRTLILAPFFSMVLGPPGSTDVRYFVLGQSFQGPTTLREVTESGTNYNLGPGPEPSEEAFLAQVREMVSPPV